MPRRTSGQILVDGPLGVRRIEREGGDFDIEEFPRLWEIELATLPGAFDERYRDPDLTLIEEAPVTGSYASRNGGPVPEREGGTSLTV